MKTKAPDFKHLARLLGLTLALVLILSASACAPRMGAGGNRLESTDRVELYEDINYHSGPGFDRNKHILDIYVPRGKRNFPVIFFVHGGAWVIGDKAQVARIGMVYANKGIGVVNVNYRLYPNVQYPLFVEDVAEAFAWTLDNIASYGGDPDKVFVMGHSAGGHLVSLISTNQRFLSPYKIIPKEDIRGVIPVSGVFHMKGRKMEKIFSRSAPTIEDASPMSNISKNVPPFLILYASDEMQGLDEQAEQMGHELRKYTPHVKVKRINGRTHGSILGRMGHPNEPATRAVLDFIAKYK